MSDTVSQTASLQRSALVDSSSLSDSGNGADEKAIAELLEAARGHYLDALQAQAEGDSATCADEFEQAIDILNKVSYYPNVETNHDFNDLSRSVIEDYEKYIATVDELGAGSSIFALREKLNLDIEKIDVSKVTIPREPVTGTTIPLVMNELVEKNIYFFMDKGREYFERWLYLSGKYFPVMSRIFAEEGIPQEMMYLAMMESGLNPVARSWAKAVGMWQFMKWTGSLYGLRGNYWFDERRDFEKATWAAARHLKDLYALYDDWYLAIAAYNSGGGRINRGIRRSRTTDFWAMRRYLPRETRNYVPQFIAVTLMGMKPEAYGFVGLQRADSLSYEYVTVDDCVDLEVLAECAETTVDVIRELNPELIQWCTPPNYTGYKLRVPAGKGTTFMQKYAEVPEEKKQQNWAVHKVRRGETLSTIARKYHVVTGVLTEINKIKRTTRLKVGLNLLIPVSKSSTLASSQPVFTSAEGARPRRSVAYRHKSFVPAGRDKLMYVVKKGDTLGHIAEWFGVRASDLRNWNNIPYGRFLQAGRTLAVWVPSEKIDGYKKIAGMSFEEKNRLKSVSAPRQLSTKIAEESVDEKNHWVQHSVRKGETLEKIASVYGVAIADVKSWNKLRSSKIFAGQKLEIFISSSRPAVEEGRPAKRVRLEASSRKKTGQSVHTVQKGETLEAIAGLYNVSIAELKEWNRLNSSKILSGQKIKIRHLPGEVEYYKVRRGDNLWTISRKFGVTVDDIERWNNVAEDIHPGDQIVIYR